MMEKHIQIIAGRPSSGKTLLSSQYCRTAIIDGKSVLFFSLEQSKQRLQQLYGIPKMVEVIENTKSFMEKYISDYCHQETKFMYC